MSRRFLTLSMGRSFRCILRRSIATSTPRSSSQALERVTNISKNMAFFSYTSGRFLFNEGLRLKERYVEFDVEALKHAAETAFDSQHGRVVQMTKLAEGGFNRVFLLAMEDGFEVIAKVPYHIAGPKYYATASEAATLAFLRLKGIPVPEVYGYSATPENPVGTEYILMQKAPGVCVATRWLNLQEIEMKRLAHSFVELEKVLFDLSFGSTGSLYFKKDISSDLQAPLYAEGHDGEESNQFCIGPIADYMFWYGRRARLNLDRGPWKNPVDYLRSIAQKEVEWTKLYGKPLEPDFPHNTLGLGVQSPKSYIDLLESYQMLALHLLPKDQASRFNQPTLRHPDLTPGNIFISPDTGRISCLIDWQHTITQPQLLAAGYPRAFENPDDTMSPDLVEPSLPQDFDSLPPQEKAAAAELHRQRLMFYSYRVLNGHLNQPHIAALRDPLLIGRQLLVDRAGRQWEGNIITLKGVIVRATQLWSHLPDVEGINCPIQFDQAELDKFFETEEGWLDMNILVEHWRRTLHNMREDGWVRNEDYDDAMKKLEELKHSVRQDCEGDEEDIKWFERGWPFRDHEEVD